MEEVKLCRNTKLSFTSSRMERSLQKILFWDWTQRCEPKHCGRLHSKLLEDGIFEIRTKFGSDITRVLYFFVVGKKVILTNGFVKKTQKTPASEITLARQYRTDYLTRRENLK